MPNEEPKTGAESGLVRPGTLRRVLIALGLASIVFLLLYLLRRFAGALLLIFAGVLFGIFLRGLAVLLRAGCGCR